MKNKNNHLAHVLIHGHKTNHGFENFEEWQRRELGLKKVTGYLFGTGPKFPLHCLTKKKK